MLSQIMQNVLEKTTERILNIPVLNRRLQALAQRAGNIIQELDSDQVPAHSLPAALAEKAPPSRFPTIHLSCTKLKNRLEQKFNRFSGTASLVLEVRFSSDRVEELERQGQVLADALSSMIDENRGNWGNGIYCPGTYEVAFNPIREGGKRYLRSLTVSFDVDVHID